MKLFLVFGLIVSVSAFGPFNGDYHTNVGIPAAARIKQAEESVDFDGARITGGSGASLGQFPYMGGLVITLPDNQYSVCGSSLISNTRGGTRINTSNVRMHESYNPSFLYNDIAIIVINHVGYNNNIRNINLASGNDKFVGAWASAAGFGITTPGTGISQTLNHVNLQVISNEECRRTFLSVVISSTLCVATPSGRSICTSDSGGPLVIGTGADRQLIGVTSFFHREGCTEGYPAGFARITSFHAWIRSHI